MLDLNINTTVVEVVSYLPSAAVNYELPDFSVMAQ